MKLSLIRELNESIRDKDPVEQALNEMGFAFDMEDGTDLESDEDDLEGDFDNDEDEDEDDEFEGGDEDFEGEDEGDEFEDEDEDLEDEDEDLEEPNLDDVELDEEELERIAEYYRDRAEGMEDEELEDAIGEDLYEIEYTPEQIGAAIPKIMALLGRGEEPDEADENELDLDNDSFSADDEFGDEPDEDNLDDSSLGF